VKTQPTLTVNLAKEIITLGQNITITGTYTPNAENATVEVQYFSSNATETLICPVAADGSFTGSFQPDSPGTWCVLAKSPETHTHWATTGPQLIVSVNEPPVYVKYSLYIIIGLVVALAVSGAVYFLKFRNR